MLFRSKENDNGYLFEPKDEETLAEHILTILSNPEKQEKMSQRSREIVMRHSIDNAISDYESIYKDLAKTS